MIRPAIVGWSEELAGQRSAGGWISNWGRWFHLRPIPNTSAPKLVSFSSFSAIEAG